MNNKPIYFPGLNGLRAIAAIAVVVSHITLALDKFGLDPYLFGKFPDGKPHGWSLAAYGVSIFFVLSGFLITFLLQTEREATPINIPKFYLRRILRIWPLYYLYLTACMITILITGMEWNGKSLGLYIFYAANIPFILNTSLPFLAHYWSLGVEEQFYLFWPWVNKKISNILPFTIGLIFLLIGAKIWLHFKHPDSLLENALNVTRFHCMLLGAAGAILFKKKQRLFLQITDNLLTQIICWGILFLVAINRYHLASFIDNEIISLVALCLIIGQINIKNRLINLETKALDFLGKISYGIYVIHPLLIFFVSNFLGKIQLSPGLKYPLVYLSILVITILFAHFSYQYFELYFLRFKKKFEIVKSKGSGFTRS